MDPVSCNLKWTAADRSGRARASLKKWLKLEKERYEYWLSRAYKGRPPPPLQIRLRLTMNYNKINLSRDSASKYLLSLKIGSFGSGIKSGEWRLKWSRNSAWCAKRPPHLKHSSSILSPVCSQKWISRKTGLSNFRPQMEQMLSFSCVASNETNWALIAASTGTFGPTFAVTVTPGASTTTLGIWKY